MNKKILSIVAAVIGCLCAAFAVFTVYVAVSIAGAMPFAAGNYDSKYFWWPMSAAVAFWALAVFGSVSRRKHRQNHPA
jgi:hypothetical protein